MNSSVAPAGVASLASSNWLQRLGWAVPLLIAEVVLQRRQVLGGTAA
jgi:hypothetical protein